MSDSITVKFLGKSAVSEKMALLGAGAARICGEALYTEAQLVMTDIKSHDVPVANPAYYDSIGQHNITPGTLRASGYVDLPVARPPTGTVVVMGFGGAAAAYAHYQHEGRSWQTGKPLVYHGQGGANYLVGPANEHAPEFRDAVREAILAGAEKL